MMTLARASDADDIVRRLRRVRPDSAARWGRMSAHQMICHLADALRMATGERAVSAASGVLHRTILKWITLYGPLPWPAGIMTRPELDQECGGTRPADFTSDVRHVETLLALIGTQHKRPWPAHPIFGRMSRTAWLRWGYLHTDHHLRQFGV